MAAHSPFSPNRGQNQIVIASTISDYVNVHPKSKSIRCVTGPTTAPLLPAATFARNYVAYGDTDAAGVRTLNSTAVNIARTSSRLDAGGTLRTGYQGELVGANAMTLSEDLHTWPTKNDVTTADNIYVAPNGLQTADRITVDATTALHRIRNVVTYLTGNICNSLFAKAITGRWVAMRENSVGSDYAWFDLLNGVVGTVNPLITSTGIEPWGNGWFRIWANETHGGGGGALYIFCAPSNGVTSYLGAGETYSFWGVQTELGDRPSSYIPTAGAAPLTRLADQKYWTGLTTLGTASNRHGRLEFSFLLPDYNVLTAFDLIRVNVGGLATDQLKIGVTTADFIVATETASGQTGCTITGNTDVANNVLHAVILEWENNKVTLTLDGVVVGTSVVCGLMPSGIDRVYIDGNMGLIVGDIELEQNGGICHVRIGEGPQVATTADTPLLTNSELILTKQEDHNTVAYMTEAGVVELHIQPGEGGM